MTCKDCIFNEICERQEDLVQLDDLTWDEYGECDEVERYCSIFRSKANFVEVVRCSECKHLEIVNKAPIYAKCKKHGIVFELWQEDTRENFCSFGARMDGDDDETV